jgi:hypothetical protein
MTSRFWLVEPCDGVPALLKQEMAFGTISEFFPAGPQIGEGPRAAASQALRLEPSALKPRPPKMRAERALKAPVRARGCA